VLVVKTGIEVLRQKSKKKKKKKKKKRKIKRRMSQRRRRVEDPKSRVLGTRIKGGGG